MNPAALLLAAVVAAVDAEPASPTVARVHDLARLSPAEAERLQGRRALFRIALDSPCPTSTTSTSTKGVGCPLTNQWVRGTTRTIRDYWSGLTTSPPSGVSKASTMSPFRP